MPEQLELKLTATHKKLFTLQSLALPGISAQSLWKTTHLHDTYFDNQQCLLRSMNISLRLRNVDHKYIQCVKSSGKNIAGVHQRNEENSELKQAQLDLSQIHDPYLKILIDEALEEGGYFNVCFSIIFIRSHTILNFPDGTSIEIALNDGKIIAGKKEHTLCEVELNLIEGSADYIFALGRYLIKELDLVLTNSSKAHRGYSLCHHFNPQQKIMSVTELTQGVESEIAFKKICSNTLHHWQYYELFLEYDNAHTAILEMYRALMCFQHIYWVFSELIPSSSIKSLKSSWDWLAEAMKPIVDAAKQKRYLNSYSQSEKSFVFF
jgi:triphosphatase